MNSVSVINTLKTMTSREIAELTGKQHGHVLRDIRRMLSALYPEGFDHSTGAPKLDLLESKGIFVRCNEIGFTERVDLPKEETLCLVSGYDAKMRMAIIRRWQELETQQQIALPQSLPEALRLAADLAEKKALAEQQRDEAIATKALIGHRREATAMATASHAVKKANKLEIELDKSKQYATVKRMEMVFHGQKFKWKLLMDTSKQMGILPIDVFDANYGTVKAYHADVWLEAYAIDIAAGI